MESAIGSTPSELLEILHSRQSKVSEQSVDLRAALDRIETTLGSEGTGEKAALLEAALSATRNILAENDRVIADQIALLEQPAADRLDHLDAFKDNTRRSYITTLKGELALSNVSLAASRRNSLDWALSTFNVAANEAEIIVMQQSRRDLDPAFQDQARPQYARLQDAMAAMGSAVSLAERQLDTLPTLTAELNLDPEAFGNLIDLHREAVGHRRKIITALQTIAPLLWDDRGEPVEPDVAA